MTSYKFAKCEFWAQIRPGTFLEFGPNPTRPGPDRSQSSAQLISLGDGTDYKLIAI